MAREIFTDDFPEGIAEMTLEDFSAVLAGERCVKVDPA
jgi:hypothetical protein